MQKILNIINEIKQINSYKLQKNNIVIKNIIDGDWLLEYSLLNINVKSLSLPFNNYFFSSLLYNYKKLYTDLKPHFFISITEVLYNKFATYLIYAVNESVLKNEIKNQLKIEHLKFIMELSENYGF